MTKQDYKDCEIQQAISRLDELGNYGFRTPIQYVQVTDSLAFVRQDLEIVKQALERAKKVEEELEECNISDKSKEESSIEYYNLYKETKRKLKKVEVLLRMYRKYSKGLLSGKLSIQELHELNSEIKLKEKELEEMK